MNLVVLLHESAHEQLRQAAFDRRRTMWSIAREALDMWFTANGYEPIASPKETEVEEAA